MKAVEERLWRVIRFLLVFLVAMAVQYAVGLFFPGDGAQAVGWLLWVILSYIGNRYFVFFSQNKRATPFFLEALLFFGLRFSLYMLFVHLLPLLLKDLVPSDNALMYGLSQMMLMAGCYVLERDFVFRVWLKNS